MPPGGVRVVFRIVPGAIDSIARGVIASGFLLSRESRG
jgi:hypothetical protein